MYKNKTKEFFKDGVKYIACSGWYIYCDYGICPDHKGWRGQ